MEKFLQSNPGLRSRFAREITFPDYTTDELGSILTGMAAEADYELDDQAREDMTKVFDRVVRSPGFGNARYARTLFEQAINRQAYRLSTRADVDQLDRRAVSMVTAADMLEAASLLDAPTPPSSGNVVTPPAG